MILRGHVTTAEAGFMFAHHEELRELLRESKPQRVASFRRKNRLHKQMPKRCES